ncbi:protein unc-13 homolog 4B-like isoform X2 [Artemia franciscana]|uniref:protein unc-13 homolog 4B-like isoform X2 n=1 Tax=Artemia franciscana TaxID=6661 RepID=UPI0032D9B8C5
MGLKMKSLSTLTIKDVPSLRTMRKTFTGSILSISHSARTLLRMNRSPVFPENDQRTVVTTPDDNGRTVLTMPAENMQTTISSGKNGSTVISIKKECGVTSENEKGSWRRRVVANNRKNRPMNGIKRTEENTRIRDENAEFFDEFSRIKDRLDEKNENERRRPSSIAGNEAELDAEGRYGTVPRPRPRLRQTAQLKKFAKAARVVAILTGEAAKKAESLYEEALYYAYFPIGPDATDISSDKEELYKYLRSVFSVSEGKHEAYLEAVKEKTPPEVLLKLGLIEARNLRGKDVRGTSDPYCIIWTSSNPSHKSRSTYKETDLNPVWKENFVLEVRNPAAEMLHLELYDYDPEQSVVERLGQISEIKSMRGFGKLFKDVTGIRSSSNGTNQNHEFLGSVIVPLKSVPASGIERWYLIEGKNPDANKSKKNRGELRLHLALTSSNAKGLYTLPAMIKHEQFLRYIYDHEIRKDEDWFGMLPAEARQIIVQHACHHGLTSYESDLVRWKSLFDINLHRALDPLQFLPILERIKRTVEEEKYSVDQEEYLWHAMDKFSEYCTEITRKHRKIHYELAGPDQLRCLIKCLSVVVQLDKKRNNPPKLSDIKERMQVAVLSGTFEWMQYVIDTTRKEGSDVSTRLEHAVSLANNALADLRRALDHYNVIFCEFLNAPYFMLIYQIFDQKLAEISHPVVQEATGLFADLLLDGSGKKEGLTLGAALFELYLLLQQFHKLSTPFPEETISQMSLYGYNRWFFSAITKWLQIATIKALNLIEKAVEIDTLKQVDAYHKYSTSAVDCVQVFHQVKTSWKQLGWPNPEESLAYVLKILEDICRCADFYSVSIATKFNKMLQEHTGGKITEEILMAVNNLIFVRDSIEPLVPELGLSLTSDGRPNSALLRALASLHNEAVAMSHVKTVQALIANCAETIETRVSEMWDEFGEAMMPDVLQFTRFACDNSDNRDLLLDQYDINLNMAKERLSSDDLFQQCLTVHCELAWKAYCKIVLEKIEEKQPPALFQNISNLVKSTCLFFYGIEDPEITEELMGGALLKEVQSLLDIYAAETWQIIHRYLINRQEQQQDLAESPYGALAVKAMFSGTNLFIEVLNARKLVKMDIGGKADPYVKVRLEPSIRYPENAKERTKVVKNNLYPLFDETFIFPVAPALQKGDSLVVFTVKDYDLVGSSEFMGEAFLHFRDVVRGLGSEDLKEVNQVVMPLTRPTESNHLLETLELRSWDRLAKNFVKREKKNIDQKLK